MKWPPRLARGPCWREESPRRLFLDDDPERAATFLGANPDSTWVRTVPECLEKLTEPWDEIHLDHDLGGEHFVDVDRGDCGMEVVRWLAKGPRPHLRRASFTVHSHNMPAALEMVLRLRGLGYRVEARPFGLGPTGPGTSAATPLLDRVRAILRRTLGLELPPAGGPVVANPPDDLG